MFGKCNISIECWPIVRWNHNLLGSELFSVSNIQIRSLLFLWCDGNHNQKSRKYIKWRFKVHTWHDNQPFLNWRKRIVSIIVSFKLQIIRAPLYKWTVLTGCLSWERMQAAGEYSLNCQFKSINGNHIQYISNDFNLSRFYCPERVEVVHSFKWANDHLFDCHLVN